MANTAYEEALTKVANGEDPDGTSIPSYMVASDTLNVANGNKTFLQGAADAVESIPKFIGLSMVSGANQIYNIPADVGNLLGGDFERRDTEDIVATLDSDLGAFYREHQTGIDLVGFMASSLVPGMGGVKVLNAGQASLRGAIGAGKFGTGLGKGLGLLAPQRNELMRKAIKEVANNSSVAKLSNVNALKAISAGAAQNFYEAAAFEVAVASTMFNSPVLEDQDFGDLLTNIAIGGGLFGFIGGAVDATKISFALKNTADKAALQARPWSFIEGNQQAELAYERIALSFKQLDDMPPIPTNLAPSRINHLNSLAASTRTRIQNDIRTELGNLANGDQVVAETLFQTFKAAPAADAQAAFIGMIESSGLQVSSKAVRKMEKLQIKVRSGKASAKELEEYATTSVNTSYAKAWGENLGMVSPDMPIITHLSDTLKKGESIKIKPSGVSITGSKRSFSFNTLFNIPTKGSRVSKKVQKPWNIMRASTLEANARYLWASKLATFKPTALKPITVHVDDIPLMEKVLADVPPDSLKFMNFVGLKEGEMDVLSAGLQRFLGDRKVQIANRLLNIRGESAIRAGAPLKKPLVQEEISAIVNVKSKLLSGELKVDATNPFHLDDMLALQNHAETYTKRLVAQGARKEKDGLVEMYKVPQHLKLTYDLKAASGKNPLAGVNNFVVENMTIIKEQQRLYQEGTARASANALGPDYEKLIDFTTGFGGTVERGAKPSGAGAGRWTAASANYGGLASFVEYTGSVTSRMITKAKTSTADALEPLLYKLGNKKEAAIEWSTLQANVRSMNGMEYALNEAGDALEPATLVRWRKAAAEAAELGDDIPKEPVIPSDVQPFFPLLSPEVRTLVKAHIEINGGRTNKLAGIRTAQGVQINRGSDVFYPIPVDPRDYKHFAMVTDESITSGNHTKMLYANSEEDLSRMVAKMRENPQLKVSTKREAEESFRARGEWDYEKTLNSNYLDTEARRKGASAPHIVTTDPQKIVTDTLRWHMQRETGLVREAVAAKYEVPFRELTRLGDEATNIATSQFSNATLLENVDAAIKNPFQDYIKTALGIRKTSNYPWWTNVNTMADEAVSKVLRRATAVMEGSKSPEALLEVNRMLERAGYKGAGYDESMQIFANTGPARGALNTVVQKANSIMATVVLRWDALNSVNNAVSANVLLGAETKAVMRAISRGDEEAVGALAALTRIKVPGIEESIMSPTKLIANSIRKFGKVGRDSPEFAFFKDNGYMTRISDQYKNTLDDITFRGNESIKTWGDRIDGAHGKLASLGDLGEKWTGNRLAEEFNRFVAADVMKQMTDIATSRGLMTAKEQLAYINTFVNRTQGNYLAAQRPNMFQGPIGQAIGLFQTYQFNLMQQLLRHVGEGHAKDAMTLLALQGTIHGMNGLPAFNAVNTHLVGNASGNQAHRDAYDTVYGIAGKQAGDWLMYGVASNAMGLLHPDLKVNLYTRGDINPRHVTIIPTNPSTIPIVQATGKFLANIWKTTGTLAAGGDINTTLLQGLEHNGISRPLAGLAQTMQGVNNVNQASYSTSKRGNVIASNDLLSWANLGRVVGGKPLDEAIALDATYRFKAYGLEDSKRRTVLGNAIKTTMIAGGNPTQDQIEGFAEEYAASGGRQEEFAGWFTQLYKTANLSQANKIQQSLRSPFTQSMQEIMGGRELRDFTDN